MHNREPKRRSRQHRARARWSARNGGLRLRDFRWMTSPSAARDGEEEKDDATRAQ